MEEATSVTLAAVSIVMTALQNGTFSAKTLENIINTIDLGPTETQELEYMLSSMSPDQLLATFKALVASDDADIGPNMIRTVWALLGISSLVLVARLLVKLRTARRLYWDDICMIFALTFGYLHAISISKSYGYGLGRHMIYLAGANRDSALRWTYISIAWGFLSPLAGRLGFCMFLALISGIDRKVKKWTIYTFMVLQVVVNLGSILTMYFQCGSHLYVLWGPTALTDSKKYCWNPEVQTDYGYFCGSFNTLTDVFLTAVPGALILHASIPPTQKIGLVFMLCLSILAMAASIVKTHESNAMSKLSDYTYDFVPYVIWVSIEANVVMIAASIPVLRPLTRSVFKKARGALSRHGRAQERFDSINLGSITSKAKMGHAHFSSSSSCEHIAPQMDPFAITQTREVEVVNTQMDATLVHAALVGLVKDDTAVSNIWH